MPDEQNQDEYQKNDIFGKRLPRGQFNGITKTPTIGNLIIVSGVES